MCYSFQLLLPSSESVPDLVILKFTPQGETGPSEVTVRFVCQAGRFPVSFLCMNHRHATQAHRRRCLQVRWTDQELGCTICESSSHRMNRPRALLATPCHIPSRERGSSSLCCTPWRAQSSRALCAKNLHHIVSQAPVHR